MKHFIIRIKTFSCNCDFFYKNKKYICLFILGDKEIGNLLNDSDSDQDFEIETKSSKKRTAAKATPAKTVPKSTTKSTAKAKESDYHCGGKIFWPGDLWRE